MPVAKANSTMRTKDLLAFIGERHNIYRRKGRGEPKPWTTEPILQQWKFCNMYRELDTETMWITEHWREPNADDIDLCFAMAVARFVNWHPSLEAIGYPVPWRPKQFVEVLSDRSRRGVKVWTGAYMIVAKGFPGTGKQEQVSALLTNLWDNRAVLRSIRRGSLANGCRLLTAFPGVGGFMAGQIIADLKYVEPLRQAQDWWTWAVSGPGSRRGLNRVVNLPKDTAWNESTWLDKLRALHVALRPLIKKSKLPRMHAQDLQNCLCEFDKFERLRLGEGKPRAKYPGAAEAEESN